MFAVTDSEYELLMASIDLWPNLYAYCIEKALSYE